MTTVQENKIVWLRNASSLPFVRRHVKLDAHTRSGKIASPDKNMEVIGYEVLTEDAERNSNGKFSRAYYTTSKDDKNLLVPPTNAVDPKTLSGKGRKTTVRKT